MKRLTVLKVPILRRIAQWSFLVIILAGLPAVCLSQRRSGVSPPKIVQLPKPRLTGPVSLEQTLAKRRSVRRFTSQPLTLAQIGQLAWAGQGITEKQSGFRTAPSAGAVYPIELYFATQEAVFVYHPEEHSLEKILNWDVRGRLAAAALGQNAVAEAGCDIIVAGSAIKLAARYGNAAGRFMLLEAGHVAQNIQLQAVSLELGSVPVGGFDIGEVGRIFRLPIGLEPIYIICVGYPAAQATIKRVEEEKKTHLTDSTKIKKAVLIIASGNFRDEELFETKRAITKSGVETVIASTKTGVIKGMLGGKAEAAILVNELSVDDYDAIIFVGGSGAREYFNSQAALNIARQAVEKQKVLAAICIAPAILANAGVLDGVRATSFSSERLKLKKAGAKFTGTAVERDGLIITGSGPRAASRFGKAIADALQEGVKLKTKNVKP